ncbi:MAG: type II CAAX endopeptidase family protein [Ornithinibacter sp.]
MTRAAGGPRPWWASAFFVLGTLLSLLAPPLVAGVFTDQDPAVLVVVAVVELALVWGLVRWWLHRRNLSWRDTGLARTHWLRDAALGAAIVPVRLLLEFGVLVPASGGASNPGVVEVLDNAAAGAAAVAATLVLGVVGGGVAEELWFRGFLMGVLPEAFGERQRAVWVAALVSVVLFAVLHFPVNGPDVVSILVAGTSYAGLFLVTGRLTASVVSHSLWNIAAVVVVLAIHG